MLVATVVRDREPVRSEYCVAEVGKTRAQIDIEQARWTTLMAAISQRRGLPPRATTIAIATAFQESKIHNLDYGDRDSVGLFQQRPSQGWGTREQMRDPRYSIGKFYDGLVKVKGYTSMSITEAAQRVQRSAYPGAYAQHEDYARALASSLRGYSPAAFSCRINATAGGTTGRRRRRRHSAFGDIPIGGRPGRRCAYRSPAARPTWKPAAGGSPTTRWATPRGSRSPRSRSTATGGPPRTPPTAGSSTPEPRRARATPS